MTIAKPTPSDPSMRATRVADSPALPVTEPVQAPGGAPSPNSVRSREEGLGVKPAVVEENLAALAELADGEPAVEEKPEPKPEPKKAPAKKAAAKKAPAKTTKKAAKK